MHTLESLSLKLQRGPKDNKSEAKYKHENVVLPPPLWFSFYVQRQRHKPQ